MVVVHFCLGWWVVGCRCFTFFKPLVGGLFVPLSFEQGVRNGFAVAYDLMVPDPALVSV